MIMTSYGSKPESIRTVFINDYKSTLGVDHPQSRKMWWCGLPLCRLVMQSYSQTFKLTVNIYIVISSSDHSKHIKRQGIPTKL
jgi:hypothetical protein